MNPTLRTLLIALALTAPAPLALARGPTLEGVRPSSPSMASLFRHVTITGTTKPDGAALDGRLGTSPHLEAAERRLSEVVRTAICRGC